MDRLSACLSVCPSSSVVLLLYRWQRLKSHLSNKADPLHVECIGLRTLQISLVSRIIQSIWQMQMLICMPLLLLLYLLRLCTATAGQLNRIEGVLRLKRPSSIHSEDTQEQLLISYYWLAMDRIVHRLLLLLLDSVVWHSYPTAHFSEGSRKQANKQPNIKAGCLFSTFIFDKIHCTLYYKITNETWIVLTKQQWLSF